MVMRDPIADGVTDARRRLINLERRFRDLKLVKFFNDLGDVPPFDRFDAGDDDEPPFDPEDSDAPVVWGVRLDDEGQQRWAPIELEMGSGGGVLSTASVIGGFDGGDYYNVDWNEGGWTITGSVSSTVSIDLRAPEPGFYAFHAQLLYGTGTIRINTTSLSPAGWRYASETGVCRPYPYAIDDSSASVEMPCVPGNPEAMTGARLLISAGTDNEWRIQGHLIRTADIIGGDNCGT